MDWLSLVKTIALVALKSNPKTAPIADEVADGIVEADQIFGGGTGTQKLDHVVNIGKQAAQAWDELRGGPDEVEGPIGVATAHVVEATNAIIAATKATSAQGDGDGA